MPRRFDRRKPGGIFVWTSALPYTQPKMPDQVYLSLWIRNFQESNMLRHFDNLLHAFPFSKLRPGIAGVRVHAIEESEPAVFEQVFTGPVDPSDAVELSAEFQNRDCAFVVDGWWELWQPGEGWTLAPSPVTLFCFAPDFENPEGDNLRIQLGPESLFLPDPDSEESIVRARSNLRSLVRLMKELRSALPVTRQHVWTESGADFAARLDAALAGEE